MKSNAIGVNAVLKFYLSKDPKGVNRCISRTLGKLAMVDTQYDGMVKDQDIWVCSIINEIKPGLNHGLYILKPIKKIDPDDVKKLIPGFYNTHADNNVLFLHPKDDKGYWIVSCDTRKIYSEKYASIIIPHNLE